MLILIVYRKKKMLFDGFFLVFFLARILRCKQAGPKISDTKELKATFFKKKKLKYYFNLISLFFIIKLVTFNMVLVAMQSRNITLRTGTIV